MAPDAADNAGPASAPIGLLPFPPVATGLAGKANDLEALRDAVVEAASVGAGLWFSYLFVLFYLLIAAGSVTHRNLFLESPVKLPFLQVHLPLLGFFWLGPLIFLIVHAYVLLHFVLLAGKVGDFDAEPRLQITDEDVRKRLRRLLPSNIFVQILAGPREVRSGVLGFLLRLIAQVSRSVGDLRPFERSITSFAGSYSRFGRRFRRGGEIGSAQYGDGGLNGHAGSDQVSIWLPRIGGRQHRPSRSIHRRDLLRYLVR
jgi:hypothetical protein